MSDAWKALERETAKALGGRRIVRGDDFALVAPDVAIDDLPHWKVDAKYRRAQPWKHHGFVEEIAAKYCEQPGDVPVLVTKTGRERGAYVTMRLSDFAGVLTALRAMRRECDRLIAGARKELEETCES